MQQQTTSKTTAKTPTPVAAMAFLQKGKQNKTQQEETMETTAAPTETKETKTKEPKEKKERAPKQFDARKITDHSDDRLLKSRERTQARIDEARKAGKNPAEQESKLVAINAEIAKRNLKQ